MSCSNSFHAEQGFRLNLEAQETDLGSGGLRARHAAAWPLARHDTGGQAGVRGGVHAALLKRQQQQQSDSCGMCAEMKKTEVLCSGKARERAFMRAPRNAHSHSSGSGGASRGCRANLQVAPLGGVFTMSGFWMWWACAHPGGRST